MMLSAENADDVDVRRVAEGESDVCKSGRRSVRVHEECVCESGLCCCVLHVVYSLLVCGIGHYTDTSRGKKPRVSCVL